MTTAGEVVSVINTERKAAAVNHLLVVQHSMAQAVATGALCEIDEFELRYTLQKIPAMISRLEK
jgi:hypothetical protein